MTFLYKENKIMLRRTEDFLKDAKEIFKARNYNLVMFSQRHAHQLNYIALSDSSKEHIV